MCTIETKNADEKFKFTRKRLKPGLTYVDHTYQRQLRPWKKEYREELAGEVVVNVRDDGKIAIIDGQHRKDAAERQGIATIPCKAFKGLTVQDEARLHDELNQQRNQSRFDRFKARLAAGEPVEEEISALMAKHGYRIVASSKSGTACSAVAVLYKWHARSAEKFGEAIALLAECFHGEGESLQRKFLEAWFRLVHNNDLDHKRAKRRFKNHPAAPILAKHLYGQSDGRDDLVLNELLRIYNYRLKEGDEREAVKGKR